MDSFRVRSLTISGKKVTVDALNNLYVDGSLIGGLTIASGTLLWNRDESLSGSLDATGIYLLNQISATSAGVTSLNGLTGVVDVTGAGDISSFSDGNTIYFSGDFVSPNATGSFVTQGDLNASGSLLWSRDEGLSQNITNLSGDVVFSVETGGFLDHASGTLLYDRDTELSSNVADISGNVDTVASNLGVTGETLWLRDTGLSVNLSFVSGNVDVLEINIGNTGQTLWLRDAELSNNLAAISGLIGGGAGNVLSINGVTGLIELTGLGNVDIDVSGTLFSIGGTFVTPNETGGFLDHSSGTLLFDRDIELSNNLASVSGLAGGGAGNVVSINGVTGLIELTGLGNVAVNVSGTIFSIGGTFVTPSETGGFLDHTSGTLLYDRDTELSNNVSTLSGDVVFNSETGDFLDPTDTAYLESRDTELSNNVATLSGNVVFSSETGDFLDITDQAALELRDTNLSSNVALISGNVETNVTNLGSTGQTLWLRDVGLSDNLASVSGLIGGGAGNVISINGVTGLIEFTGGGDVTVDISGTLFTIGGDFVTPSETGGFLDLADQTALEARDTELSNNVATLSGNVVFTSETGGFLDHTSGTLLFDRDTELSDNVSILSGNIVFTSETGGFLNHTSGTLLFDRDVELSYNLSGISGLIAAASAGVAAINSESGLLTFNGVSGVTITNVNDTFQFSGTLDELNQLSDNVALISGNISDLENQTGDYVTGVGVQNTLRLSDGLSLTKNQIVLTTGAATISSVITELEGRDHSTFQFFGRNYYLPSGSTIQLPLGVSASNPSLIYVYATPSGLSGIKLNTSTSFPSDPSGFSIVNAYVLPDFDTYINTGPYKSQRWTDAIEYDERGAISYERERLRQIPAAYSNGIFPTLQFISNTGIQVNTTSGEAYQLNKQVFPAFSGTADRTYYIGNADGTRLYSGISDLSEALWRKDGTPLANNNRYNLVIWGAINETQDECKIFVNLPTNVYSTDSAANNDANNTADTTIPIELKSVGFLIARLALHIDTSPSNSFVNIHPNSTLYDLRGLPPGYNQGAASAGAQTEFSESVFAVFKSSDSNVEITFNLDDLTSSRIISGTDEDVDLGLIGINTTNIATQTDRVTSLTGSLDATGSLLWSRDVGLSDNIVDLSGNVVFTNQTGGFLDHTSGTLLYDRDTELSDNVASISGNVDTNTTNLGATGQTLWLRDVGLSDNLVDLSGQVAFSSETGGFLDHSSGTLLFERDTELSDNVADISGNVDTNTTNIGVTGQTLWLRDVGLSDNLVALSGDVVFSSETGGFLDHSSGTLLFDRDTELSDNVATLSGNLSTSSHTQNTDIGTNSDTFEVGLTEGVILKNLNGELEVRNSGDTDYANIRVNNLTVDGTQTILNTDILNIEDNTFVINSSGNVVDAGFMVVRSGATDASLKWDESNDFWSVGLSGAENQIVDVSMTGQFASDIDISTLTTNLGITGETLWVRDEGLSINIVALSGSVDTNTTNIGATGQTLWLRDIGLSDNLVALSGDVVFSSETGGFLDLADQTALELRDTNLSDNVALISGNVDTNTTNLGITGQTLWLRDAGLSDNLIALSGNVVFSNQTGGFLDHTSGTLLFDRDTELSDNVATLSGNVVFSSETGGFLDHTSGTLLFDRDTDLSDNVALVSGLVGGGTVASINGITGQIELTGSGDVNIHVSGTLFNIGGDFVTPSETGGFLDHTSGTLLYDRDTELSDNLATLSGNVVFSSETGDFLDPTDTAYFEGRDIELSNNVATLSGNVVFSSQTGGFLDHTSGTLLFDRDTELSNNVATLSGDVVFSSETGGFLDLTDQAALELRDTNLSDNVALISGNVATNTTNLGATGQTLWLRDVGLSDNLVALSGDVVFSSETGGFLDHTSGTLLFDRDTELSNNVATLSGNVVFSSETGGFLDHSSGTLLFDRDIELSNNVSTLSGNLSATSHAQNTDIGTNSNTFEVGLTEGVILKNVNGDLEIRNSGDTDYADIRVNNLTVDGTQTILNTDILNIEDNTFIINSSGYVVDAGFMVVRSGATDASLKWDESNDFWSIGLSGAENQIVDVSMTGGLLDLADQTTLEARDTELSNNIAALSGNVVFSSETGGFLDHTSGTLLFDRDTELSDNVATLSGNVVFSSETGGFLDHTSGTLLYDRDTELSDNVATLSGSVVFPADTGGFLDHSSGTLLFDRDTELSDNVASISGNVDTNATNIGTTGQTLWLRDVGLSDNLVALSGDVVFSSETGGFLDHSSGTLLYDRDTELSNNISLLSGNSLGEEIDHWTATETLTNDYNGRYIILSTGVPQTGVLSLGLNVGFSVNFLNVNNGDWIFTGHDLRNVNDDILTGFVLYRGDTANFTLESGDFWRVDSHITGRLLDLTDQANLEARDTELSNNVATLSGNVVFNSETGGFLDHTSGTLLFDRDTELSDNVSTLSGIVVFSSETGGFLDLADQAALELRDTELSNNVASISGLIGGGDGNIISINGVTGLIELTGLGNVAVNVAGTVFSIGGTFVTPSETGGFLDLTNQTALETRDVELSNNVASISGNIGTTGQTLWIRDIGLSDNIVALSGSLGDYYLNSNPSGFTTGVGLQNLLRFGDGLTLTRNEIVLATGAATVSAVITEIDGKDNSTFQFLGRNYLLPSGANIQLPLGVSSSNPTLGYVYAVPSGADGVSLKTSTTLPSIEPSGFSMILSYVLPDFDTYINTGPYLLQRWTDAIEYDERGGDSAERERLRAFHASYANGISPNIEFISNTGIQINTTSGEAYELHKLPFPEFSGTANRTYYIGNADGTRLYSGISDLSEALWRKDGTPLANNNRYNLVIWGAINKTTDDCKLFVNLPTNVYSTDSAANNDANNTADTTIPIEFKGVGFLIARATLHIDTSPSNTWINIHPNSSLYDLRGLAPGYNQGAASAGAQTEFSESVFAVFKSSDANVEITFNLDDLTSSRIISGTDENVDLGLIGTNQTNIITQTDRITSLTGSLDASGSLLWSRDIGLSDNIVDLSGNTVFTSQTGGFLDHTSGTLLFDRDTNLSNNLASVSGLINAGAGITSGFRTTINDNVDKQVITYPSAAFGANPVISVSLESDSVEFMLGHQVSGITSTEYTLLLSRQTYVGENFKANTIIYGV